MKITNSPSPRSRFGPREWKDSAPPSSPPNLDAQRLLSPQCPPWTAATEALLRKLRGRSADDAWFELDRWGNGFLQLESGGTVVLGVQAGTRVNSSCRSTADRRRSARGMTMPRPISLGEVLAWKRPHELGLAFPAAANSTLSLAPENRPAAPSGDHTVLSATEGERFIVMHGDNYGCVEYRDADGTWRPIETVAEYMPAGSHRRYLRRIGEARGEFQRRSGDGWESECPAGIRRHRLYLIDGRFEILADAEYERRHTAAIDPMSIAADWRRHSGS